MYNFDKVIITKPDLKYFIFSILFFIISPLITNGQELINLRKKTFPVNDTIKIDSLTIVPGSIKVFNINNLILKDVEFTYEYTNSLIIFKDIPQEDSVIIEYRVFEHNFSAPVYKYNITDFLKGSTLDEDEYSFSFSPSDYRESYYREGSLSRRGSISRGLSFGNTQDVIVNSNLNLQLEGKLTDNLNVVAAITDSNIPIQPDGTSQQIHEFDKVFINLFTDDISLIAGDFEEKKPTGYFMNYYKKAQGASVSFKTPKSENQKFLVESSVSGAIAKGKNHRMEFQGVEGNQGPYRLTGANNESYIIVLAGTERIYIDGIPLTRGQDNDYIIDYNMGEIIFTPNQPINKDKRIIVEFEYSDRNYARFLFTNNNIIRTDNSQFHINLFSEGDSKNQPFDQDLRDEDKFLLSQIGDNIENALIPGYDSVGFVNDEIRYAIIDTIINGIQYDSIFIHSNDENVAHYRIRFALVGPNNGHYVKSVTAANGRVFKWVAPVNGIPQGDYMPMRLIITPKKKQLVTLGGKSNITETTEINFELGISNNDINTFSKLDSENNTGAALRFEVLQQIMKTEKNSLITSASFENVRENFEAIEQFRSQEFARDWNINDINSENNEYISSFNLAFRNHKTGITEYIFNHMNRTNEYEGIKNSLSSDFRFNKWTVKGNASLLNSNDNLNQTRFLRHNAMISRDIGIFVIGVAEQQEYNQWTNIAGDSLRNNSFNFNQFEAFVKTNDTIKNASSLTYKFRTDDLPKENELSRSTEAHDIGLKTAIISNPNHRFSTTFNYRRLYVKDTTLYSERPEDNMTGRLEHNFRFMRGVINTASFYEIGSGLERKVEFSYIEVAPGQGVYTWTDYNNNGIQELDEFEIAHYEDQANYIRIITPTDEFVKTYSNMFNQQIGINPNYIWRNEQGFKKFLSRFSNNFAYRLSSKNTSSDFEEFANPFARNIDDINLVSMTSSVRNNFGFNKTNPKFNIEYVYQTNNNKMLLVSGFDTRSYITNNLQVSSQFLRSFRLQNNISIGEKTYESEYFGSRNYNMDLIANDISLSFQPNVNNRFNINYLYQIKDNSEGEESLTGHNVGFEYRMSSVNKGTISIQTNYVYFDFIGETQNPIAYEMLEGLMPGSNITWSVGFQRQLANGLQINLNYNGRKSMDDPAVHTGGAQIRAFF